MAEEIQVKEKQQLPGKKKGFKIKTMRRDLARLRLLESEQERKKIVGLVPDKRKDIEHEKAEKEKKEIKETKEKELIKMTEDKKTGIKQVPAPPLATPPVSLPVVSAPVSAPSPVPIKSQIRKDTSAPVKPQIRKNTSVPVKPQIKKDSAPVSPSPTPIRPQIKKDSAPVSPSPTPIRPQTKEDSPSLSPSPASVKPQTKEDRMEAAKKRIQMLRSETKQREKVEQEKLKDTTPEQVKIKQWAEKQRKQHTQELKQKLEKPVQITDRLPKRPSQEKRQWVRFLIPISILIVSLGTIFSIYWFFIKKDSPTPEPEPEVPEIVEPIQDPDQEPEPNIEPEPEPESPLSLIPTTNQKNLSVSNWEEIPNALSQLLTDPTEQGLTYVLIKNNDDKYLELNNFLKAFDINLPNNLLEKLEQDITIFIYTHNDRKRLGFVLKHGQEQITEQEIRDWEENMEVDTKKFLAIPDQKYINTPHKNIFKSTQYNGVGFRFLTISLSDFGICYTIQNNRLIFTTSFEQMKSVIIALQKQEDTTSVINAKIGQLFMVGFDGTTITPEIENFFKEYKPGAVLLLSKNIENESQVKELTNNLQQLSLKETGYPLLIAVDQEGGTISRVGFLSEKTPQSEIQDTEQAYTIGLTRGQELKSVGINMNLAPILDLATEQDFLFERTFQKDAEQTGLFAKSLISGQKNSGILSAVKHFPGYGNINFDPENDLATQDTIPEISQFVVVSEANPDFVMTSNIIYKDIDNLLPFAFTQTGINLIKQTMGDTPLIITDDLDQYSLLNNYNIESIITKPLNAGVDMMIFSGWREESKYGIESFYSAFEKGIVSEQTINNTYEKIINIKQGL